MRFEPAGPEIPAATSIADYVARRLVLDFGGEPRAGTQVILTSILPVLSPRSRPMRASGAFSMPST
jgi:hypothetical protein